MKIFFPLEPMSGDQVETAATCTGVGGTMSASLTCSYNSATQILTLTNLVSANSTGPVDFKVSGITNPIDTSTVSGIAVNTYASDGSKIDAGTASWSVPNPYTVTGMTWSL